MKKKKAAAKKKKAESKHECSLNVELMKIDVVSIAKIQGIIMLFLGFFLGLLTIFLSFLYRPNGAQPMNFYFSYALLMVFSFAIAYGVMGFVFGWIVAFLYNKSACRIGGIKWELKK